MFHSPLGRPSFLVSLAVASVAGTLLIGCDDADPESESEAVVADKAVTSGVPHKPKVNPWHDIPGATYVGAQSCQACHQQEFDDWMQSHHHKAMEVANEDTVLGDFDDATFEHFGQEWRFYRKDQEFWVNAEDENGEREDFRIDYTFGFEPLQQYLIEFPGGRYQALQVCWDSRPAEQGGQRWYHLYPDEAIPPDDILHWTGIHFNWNYMCADCHSTDLHKNYDPESKAYSTTWSEMNVSCEACHGPASEHLKWAAAHTANQGEAIAGGSAEPAADLSALGDYLQSKGLVVTLKEPVEAGWAVNPETGQPQRSVPLNSTVQVETCARCHSHRQLLEPSFTPGEPFLDGFEPSLLTDQLYHHDGQVDEEVYVYGSFVQSKMYHSGVRCTDCHHPHTMKPLAPGNALCVRCHVATDYDTPKHHHHEVGSTGASCVECHMPTKHYMVVDARRDHSLRIPRPDLSEALGTPNACTQCHDDKDNRWAAEAFHEWWGKGVRNDHYGETLAAARRGDPAGVTGLLALANDSDRPGIVRATALSDLAMQPIHSTTLESAAANLGDADPQVRSQAVALMERLPPIERLQRVAPFLEDESRTVRVESARVLAAAANVMGDAQRAQFDAAAREFEIRQQAIADRAAGQLRLALFYTDLGRLADAESAYRTAFEIEPDNVPSRVNLGEMLIQQQRFEEAEVVYRDAVASAKMDENIGVARDALARFLIRQKRYDEGLEELGKAAELLPNDPRTQYFYGVALNSMGQTEQALPPLRRAADLAPNNREYLVGLATICRDAGKFDEAVAAAEKLYRLDPTDPQTGQLLQQLRYLQQRASSGGAP